MRAPTARPNNHMKITGNNPGARCSQCKHQGMTGLGHRTCTVKLPPWVAGGLPVIICSEENANIIRNGLYVNNFNHSVKMAEMCGVFELGDFQELAVFEEKLAKKRATQTAHDKKFHPTPNTSDYY